MSGKLVTFGCSYTHGPWLPDTLVDPWKKPSNFAWPKILAILLKRECSNRAVGGSGNLEILWNLLNYTILDQDDIVVIMWSHFERDTVFTKEKELNQWPGTTGHRISHHYTAKPTTKELTNNWMRVHTEHDHNVRNWIYLHHANSFLKSINVKCYHAFHPTFMWEKLTTEKPSFLKLDNILEFQFNAIDVARDNSHPGVSSHIHFAKNIFNLIQTNQTINI